MCAAFLVQYGDSFDAIFHGWEATCDMQYNKLNNKLKE